MLKLVEETTIHAPPADVFRVMTDFERYAEWNPWIREARGAASEGEVVAVKVKLGKATTSVKHRVLEIVPGVALRWCDMGWFTAIAYGERARRLEPLPGGDVAYRVELRVTGIGWRLVRALYGRALEAGMREETAALKQRAEALAVSKA
jgi:uncharacterized protein YndB with AHSA1/START domain